MQLIKEIMAEWGVATEETRQIALMFLRQNAGPDAEGSAHFVERWDRPALADEETPPSPA